MKTHNGITATEVLAQVDQIAERVEIAPYGDDRTTTFVVQGRRFVQKMRQHFSDRETMKSVGLVDPINLEYVFYSLFAEREIKIYRFGSGLPDFYYIMD